MRAWIANTDHEWYRFLSGRPDLDEVNFWRPSSGAPGPLIKVFDKCASSLLQRTLACRRENRTLAALRDALLPKLISGELRVKDAERLVARACAGGQPSHPRELAKRRRPSLHSADGQTSVQPTCFTQVIE